MVMDPHHYGMLKRDDSEQADLMRERQRRMWRRMEEGDADRQFVRLQMSRGLGWAGRMLLALSERLRPQLVEASRNDEGVQEAQSA